MKKIVYIMNFIIVLLLFYLTKNRDMLTLSVSFSMYMLFWSIFSTTKVESKSYKLFKLCLLSILVIGIGIIGISYFIGNVIDINKMGIVNLFMSVSLVLNILFRFMCDYLKLIKYRNINDKTIDKNKIILLFIKMLSIIVIFGFIRVEDYIRVLIFYSVDIFIFLVLGILLYYMVFKNVKDYIKNKENNNYIKMIKDTLIGDSVKVICNVIKCSYVYISIIVLYYILCNRYYYSYEDVSNIITNNYLYGVLGGYLLYKIVSKCLRLNVKNSFNDNINKIVSFIFPLSIIFIILSKPISYLVFGNNYNIVANIIPLFSFYVMYDFVINNNLYYNKKKNVIIVLLIGLFVSLLFEIPLIDTLYRMGYSLEFGSILSIVFGMFISIIFGIIFIKKKLKINLFDNFNSFLNIIYENIIYTLVIILCTLLIDVNTNGFIESLLVIIFYLFISLVFYIIKRKFFGCKK